MQAYEKQSESTQAYEIAARTNTQFYEKQPELTNKSSLLKRIKY